MKSLQVQLTLLSTAGSVETSHIFKIQIQNLIGSRHVSFLFYDLLKIFNIFSKSKKRNGCFSRLLSEIYAKFKPFSSVLFDSGPEKSFLSQCTCTCLQLSTICTENFKINTFGNENSQNSTLGNSFQTYISQILKLIKIILIFIIKILIQGNTQASTVKHPDV